MLNRAFVLAACATLGAAAAPVHAGDSRIRSVFYEPQRIVIINGRSDIQSTIVFAPGERVENIAIGDSAAWQVTPNKRANLLFLKPQNPRGRTNMTVITDQRTYMFDLVAQPKTGTALYALQFTYPAPPPPPPEVIKPVEVAEAPPPTTPVDLNFHWTERGSKRLLPARVFDDGKALYLAWGADVPMPAMLSVAPDGTEGPVNYSVKGDFVVVDGVPGRLVLRAGKESAMLDRGETTQWVAPASTPTQTAER